MTTTTAAAVTATSSTKGHNNLKKKRHSLVSVTFLRPRVLGSEGVVQVGSNPVSFISFSSSSSVKTAVSAHIRPLSYLLSFTDVQWPVKLWTRRTRIVDSSVQLPPKIRKEIVS